MPWTTSHPRCRRLAAHLVLLLVVGTGAGCDTGLLDVDDPTAILDEQVNDARGAELLRRGALWELYRNVGPDAWETGLFADEFRYLPGASADSLLDRREAALYLELLGGPRSYASWQSLRARPLTVALEKLRQYAVPGAREAHSAEMLALRGYATTRLAENYCPGFPLHEVVDYKAIYGPPRSTEQVLERALADLDTAVTLALAADSARVLNLARLARARTLLFMGRLADAAVAVQGVPTNYAYLARLSTSPANELAAVLNQFDWGRARSVANAEGGNGLDFIAAKDPRVPTMLLGTAGLYGTTKYPALTTPIPVATGVEARLIEAEAALAGGGDWLGMLNGLRTSGNFTTQPNAQDSTKTDTLWQAGSGNVAGLRPLADPGTPAARVNLLFRERAFWLFATGRRLADLRRLVRQYSRSRESVFPTGAYYRGGSYGSATMLPFTKNEILYSPVGVTGCTSWSD